MRRLIGWSALLLGLGMWIGIAAVRLPSGEASAQAPPVEIHRVEHAGFTPPMGKSRPIFILALGSDARPGEPVDRARADSIHIIGINPQERAATILGFPRDSYVSVSGAGQQRINTGLFYGGPELMVRTVEDLTGIPIDYYMLTSFKGTIRLVNGVGGIPIEIEYPMDDPDAGTDLQPGKQKLKGFDALAFARDRHSAPGGDFGRSGNQGRLMVAALKKFHKEFDENPGILIRWIQVALRDIQLDIPLSELFELAATATQIDPDNVTNLVVPGGSADVGGASVVMISSSAEQIYADMRDDGLAAG